MQDKACGNACRTIGVCVDSYDQGRIAGRFCDIGAEEGEAGEFHSLIQLLAGVEHMLDAAQSPQSFTARRSFAPLPEPRLDSRLEPGDCKGKLATFILRVLFRQHTSWQGSVTWVEGKGEQTFRSVLELILLMDSALRDEKGRGGTQQRV